MVLFFGHIISRCEVQPDPQTLPMFIEMPATIKRGPIFFRYNKLLGEIFTIKCRGCEPLSKLTSAKLSGCGTAHASNYMKGQNPSSSKDTLMKFFNEKEQLYLETDALGFNLGAGLLQMRDRMEFPKDEVPDNSVLQPIAFASKSLPNAETWYSNSKREDLGIWHELKKFHHYCFDHDLCMITYHQ